MSFYSICSDAYRLEDKQAREGYRSPEELDDDEVFDNAAAIDDFYDGDECYYCECDCGEYYEEEYDPVAEFYAANDPSNWD